MKTSKAPVQTSPSPAQEGDPFDGAGPLLAVGEACWDQSSGGEILTLSSTGKVARPGWRMWHAVREIKMKAMKSLGQEDQALHLAAGLGRLELVRLLLDKGANINAAAEVRQ